MGEGRREFGGYLGAWHLAGVAGMFGGKVDPAEVNPFRVADPPTEKMAALMEWRRKRAWRRFAKDAAADAKRG